MGSGPVALDHVGKDTFYGLLASLRGRLFRDSDFAAFYCADNGRDSVPPSLLATALLLQSLDKVSDAEAEARVYERYLASSIKGEAAVDWSDKRARQALLAGIVADADRMLELSRQTQGELAEGSAERQRIVAAAELLGKLLLQEIERKSGDGDDGVSLKDGVRRDRMMSVHDLAARLRIDQLAVSVSRECPAATVLAGCG